MTNSQLTASDLNVLSSIANFLLWMGSDRAADVIYTAISDDLAEYGESETGQWDEVFAG